MVLGFGTIRESGRGKRWLKVIVKGKESKVQSRFLKIEFLIDE